MATADLEGVFAAYRAAWRSHDLDAIVALHHPEGSFWLHTAGQTIAVGREAIRVRFAGTLALLPDIVFDSLRVHWGEAFLVHEMSASGTSAIPGQTGVVRFDIATSSSSAMACCGARTAISTPLLWRPSCRCRPRLLPPTEIQGSIELKPLPDRPLA
jgi:hypothetical protein